MKKTELFVSHSSKDFLVYDSFVQFMANVGVPRERIFCTSTPGTHIYTGSSLYKELRKRFNNENMIFIMLLSNNYYSSVVCLNEMGAAWVKQVDTQFFILPGFSFDKVEGVVKEDEKTGISLADINEMTVERLYDFKHMIEQRFGFRIEERLWEREREAFLRQVKKYAVTVSSLNKINMKEVEKYCIGEFEHNAWKILKKEPSFIEADLNFDQTNAELCSIVFRPSSFEWTQYFKDNMNLCFSAAAPNSSYPLLVDVEIDLYDHKRKPYLAVISMEKNDYRIPLNQFSNNLMDWTMVSQICFVLHRARIADTAQTVKIIVENIRIE